MSDAVSDREVRNSVIMSCGRVTVYSTYRVHRIVTSDYEPCRSSLDCFLQHLVDVDQLVDDAALLLLR